MTAAQARAAMSSDRVNFVNEDNAGGVLLALFKQVAYAARADADKHFNEIRTGNREEGNVCFAGNRPRQQSLACSWRSDEQHTLRNSPAKLLIFIRQLEEIDYLAHFR